MRTFLLFLFLVSGISVAGDSPATFLPEFWQAYQAGHFVPALPSDWTPEEKRIFRGLLQERFQETHGTPIGYKAALTSAAAQSKFGVDQPVTGILYGPMILEKGVLSRARGAFLFIEGDLVVRVSDTALNQAETREDVAAALDQVLPFIELPDLLFEPGTPLDGDTIAAVNAGARFGLLGEPIVLQGSEPFPWSEIQCRLLSPDGSLLSLGKGSDLLGHPLEVVLFLVRSLRQEGVELQVGDLLSLGTLGAMVPLKEMGTYRAEYQIPGRETITVSLAVEP